ncbi:DUF5331 domain-containing protein [Nostoc sp. PA-18-2419]|uniref:DUF5331 domain-containing protein n=1 Tax=Nostoc sp. PA-18-2419 TaxID=2575443 RepID=UPI00110987BB|nr:DUF5331 domain-containing protein [Nostoc sp. PA-18-2419]
MNIQELRQSLKQKWLNYYEQNISWLVKIRIWATYNGLRRPSSGFILATLSVLEPQFDEILTFMMDLNNNPDKIVAALGLNFNPDQELCLIKSENQVESEVLEDKSHDRQAVPLVLNTTKIVSDSPVKTLQSDLPRLQQPVILLTDTTELAPTPKPGTLVAVITKVTSNSSLKTLDSVQSDSGLLWEDKPLESPLEQLASGGTLTITSQVNSKAKTMPAVALATKSSNSRPVRSLAITTEISNNSKPVRSLAITTEVSKSTKHLNTPLQEIKSKVNVLPSTNARSVASWVDEFCQGMR